MLTQQLSKSVEQDDRATTVLRRLTKKEWDRSIRKLLGLESMLADPTVSFTPDDTKEGFDNIGEVLVVSDFLMNQYLAAADEYLDAAIAKSKTQKLPATMYRPPFFRQRNPADGLNVDGKYMHLKESSSGHGFFMHMEEFARSGGVPSAGFYNVRIKASAIDRDHPYKNWILDISKDDPLAMSIVGYEANAKRPDFVHSSVRQLTEFEVEDDTERWYEAKVWLDEGYSIKLGYPNGPRRIKYMRHSLMSQHRDLFVEFLKDHVHVFADMHPDYDKEKAPALVKAFLAEQDELKKAGKRYDVFGVDHKMHTDEAWKTFYREYCGPRIRVFEVEISSVGYAEIPEFVQPLVDESLSDQQAKKIIRKFAMFAARRPLKVEKTLPIMSLYDSARDSMSVNEASRLAYKAILCGPDFIYHRTKSGKLDDYELANRLSYFLSGGPADRELMKLAAKGRLDDRKTLRQQTERLLDAESSKEFVADFLDGWLKLSKLGTMQPDENKHATYFNERLEPAMKEETILFLQEAIEKDRPAQWLIDGNKTFVNAPLARLYGMQNVQGLEMRQVKIEDPMRGGLLGHASVLTATANGIDTSPVTRGVWVLECLLGTPPSPPPPDVEPLEPDIRGAVTIREQLKKHREIASCRHCHRRIDPLGFALESFDEIGRVRKEYGDWNEEKLPIDTAGKLPSGESFEGIEELRKLLVKQSRLVEKNFVSKLLVQATGRIDDANDKADVLRILSGDDGAEKPLGLRELIHRVVLSDAFAR